MGWKSEGSSLEILRPKSGPQNDKISPGLARQILGGFGQRHGTQFAPDHGGMESGAKQRAINRRGLARIERAARHARAAFDHFAHDRAFVESGEDLGDR